MTELLLVYLAILLQLKRQKISSKSGRRVKYSEVQVFGGGGKQPEVTMAPQEPGQLDVKNSLRYSQHI